MDPNLILSTYFQDPDWMFKTGVGGALYFSAFVILMLGIQSGNLVILPACFCLWAMICGYVLRTIRQRIAEPEGKLPEWTDWQDLFISGMSWIAITTGFVITLFAVATTAFVILIVVMMKASSSQGILFVCITILGIATLTYIFNFFVAMLMANFAQEETMLSGFAYLKVLKKLWKNPGDFTAAWLLGTGIQFLAFIIPAATVIGIILVPMTTFISQVISAGLIAQAWAESEAQ
jgi:hypothetical protein